jgi:hypothetical protein
MQVSCVMGMNISQMALRVSLVTWERVISGCMWESGTQERNGLMYSSGALEMCLLTPGDMGCSRYLQKASVYGLTIRPMGGESFPGPCE